LFLLPCRKAADKLKNTKREEERGGMATASVVVDKIVEWTGLNGAAVAYAARHLRDEGLNPKGKPGGGTGAAHYHTGHCVAVVVAVLSTDTVTQAAKAAAKTLNLARAEESGGGRGHDVSVQVAAARLRAEGRDDPARQVETGDLREPLVPGGTFGEALSYLVDLARTPAGRSFVERHVHSIDVSRLRAEAAIVFKELPQTPITVNPDGTRIIHAVDAPEPRKIRQMYRPSQGDLLSQLMADHSLMARVDVTASVPGAILGALAYLVLDSVRAEQDLSSRRRKFQSNAARAAEETETTTPAQDAAGPASADALASQPGDNPVDLAEMSNQQDSGRKKRGQSSPLSAPPGLPSSRPPDHPKEEPP
jgi:hypothetical protein